MSDELVSKYTAWIAQLESNIRDMARQRRLFLMMFGGFVAVSAIGFVWGWWLGVATFLTGVMVCVSGLYITMTRRWEYERELERTRAEVDRLRAHP